MLGQQLLKVPEAAQVLRLKPKTVYKLAASGVVPSVRISGSVRIPAAGLQRLIDGKTRKA